MGRLILSAAILSLSCITSAQPSYVGQGKVIKVLTDTSAYGGCMAYVDFDPTFANTGCDNWVSFGCDGQYIAKSQAQAGFSSAQLALVTGASVDVFLDPARTYNVAHCLVVRMDVAAPATP